MKHVLITGGFGFLGGYVVEELLQAEPESRIVVVDNLLTSQWLRMNF
jgi:nucleoside-diphosphate-sugar epimerase